MAPYVPPLGLYVYYGLGVLVTAVASHYGVRWMRRYLAAREQEEKKAEADRKSVIQYEEALKKIAAKTCPGCDRPLATTGEAQADFCVHCGLRLFDQCGTCDTRKYVFFRYCMTCGTPAGAKPAGAAAA